MSTFVQIIEIITDKEEELLQLNDEWETAVGSITTVLMSSVCQDRNWSSPDNEALTRYFVIVTFPSAEAAQENNELPATQEFAKRMTELCARPPKFYDLNEIRLFENLD